MSEFSPMLTQVEQITTNRVKYLGDKSEKETGKW